MNTALYILSALVFLGIVGFAAYYFWGRNRKISYVAIAILALVLIFGCNTAWKTWGTAATEKVQLPESQTNCVSAKVVTEAVDSYVETDLRTGDNVLYNLVIAKPQSLVDYPALVVLVAPGKGVDIDYEGVFVYSSYLLEGSQDSAVCFASNKISELGLKKATLLFVGSEAPKSWKTLENVGDGWWKGLSDRTFKFSQPDSGKAVPQNFLTKVKPATFCSQSGQFNHGQAWDGHTFGVVVDYVVAEGYCLTIPSSISWEGTNFFYAQYNPSTIMATVVTATQNHVDQDDIYSLTMLYCGDPAKMPTENISVDYTNKNGSARHTDGKWQSTLTGWKCEPVSK